MTGSIWVPAERSGEPADWVLGGSLEGTDLRIPQAIFSTRLGVAEEDRWGLSFASLKHTQPV
jgi:hypothetical protein